MSYKTVWWYWEAEGLDPAEISLLLSRLKSWICNNHRVILTLSHWLGPPLSLPWCSEATLAIRSERLANRQENNPAGSETRICSPWIATPDLLPMWLSWSLWSIFTHILCVLFSHASTPVVDCFLCVRKDNTELPETSQLQRFSSLTECIVDNSWISLHCGVFNTGALAKILYRIAVYKEIECTEVLWHALITECRIGMRDAIDDVIKIDTDS